MIEVVEIKDIFGVPVSRVLGLLFTLCVSISAFGVGFTPTDGGLVVNLKTGDRILLSVMVDHDGDPATPDREYFVENYTRYTGDDYFMYNPDSRNNGHFLRLVTQETGATEPASMSVWTVDSALTRVDANNVAGGGAGMDYALGGISYTIWNDSRTLRSDAVGNDRYRIYGDLSDDKNSDRLCDVVFVIPTERSTITSFDPNKTLTTAPECKMSDKPTQDAQGRFNGRTGTGFLGMTYREVYWMAIPRFNAPVSYTNAAVMTFNVLNTAKTWNKSGQSGITIGAGMAGYAFADDKHKPTARTIFRLYVLNDPIRTCPDSYFFAYNGQDSKKYREGPSTNPKKSWTDSTAVKKVYTMDRLFRMDRVGDTEKYQTEPMQVPVSDSSYYYVGWHDDYRNGSGASSSEPLGSSTAKSQFTAIRTLPLSTLPAKAAPAGASGRMVVDTTSSADNLGVQFEPAGYFLRTNSGKNVRMHRNDDGTWRCEEMWHITDEYTALTIKATLFSGPEFSDINPGVDIPGWSEMVVGTEVPLADGRGTVEGGMDGWAQIDPSNPDPNGGMVFILANSSRHLRYDNNGCIGSAIADQYPIDGETTVTVRDGRLSSGFTFLGWNTQADGSGTPYAPGAVIELPEGETTLYAQATFNADMHIAISFMKDGERYFLTYPSSESPRFARARKYDDWTNVRQGMSDQYNSDPNYVNTFAMVDGCLMCQEGERGLNPKRDTMRLGEDSLIYYQEYSPSGREYMGLYYVNPWNTILADATWAGMFGSTGGWPNFRQPYIASTKLHSEEYVKFVTPTPDHPMPINLYQRVDAEGNPMPPYVKYMPETNQFDGVELDEDPTDFQLTAVALAEGHYIIQPDTTVEWNDEVVFDLHQGEQTEKEVWSKLIGKQLMATMSLGDDTVYFHPNLDKIYTTASELWLSQDFRLAQSFEYIRDARVESLGTVAEEDKPQMSETTDDFGRLITSGLNSPMDVVYMGNHIDIEDTIRVTLRPYGTSRIKEYFGRWKKGAAGLSPIGADGSRHRDIIVRTKTYHYGPTQTRLELIPENESYNFTPFADNHRTVNFTLTKVTSRAILDKDNQVMSEEITSIDTINSSLALAPSYCSFTSGGAYFQIYNSDAVSQHATITTKTQNSSSMIYDTMVVELNITVDAVTYPVTAQVPLVQASLVIGEELIWSVSSGDNRYYIMAGTGGLIFRKFTKDGSTLYKEGTKTALVKGSLDPENSDAKYITPWRFRYKPKDASQLSLKTENGVERYFKLLGENAGDKGGISENDSSFLTFHYVNIYINDNANEEELVKLQYGADKWLQFTLMGGDGAEIRLVDDEEDASVFSWSYLLQEYDLLNNGTYPSRDSVVFGYNTSMSVGIQTRYKAYKEYSMLVGNKVVYCCRVDENDIADLISDGQEWRTNYAITYIPDARDFDGDPNPTSGLTHSLNTSTLTTTVSTTTTTTSPTEVSIGGKYVNIVDTLHVNITLDREAPEYRFKNGWAGFKSIADAERKIPLIRKTYHVDAFDSVKCIVVNDEYNYTFPSEIIPSGPSQNNTHTFEFETVRRKGSQVLDVNNTAVAILDVVTEDLTDKMDFTDSGTAAVQLDDGTGSSPSWCRIATKGENTITVECTENGIRTPRTASLSIVYVMTVKNAMNEDEYRFVNFHVTVSQPSLYEYANNQHLVHSKGASGDELDDKGMQRVHENRRILYYYPDQNVELPVRDSHFFGWWRWFREGDGEIGDSDIPDESWRTMPRNVDAKYNYPFRIIGDSVWVDKDDHTQGKKLLTMGRYTVFHYRSKDYANVRNDPPVKTALVAPPITEYGLATKPTVTYAVDISNYYDKLPMSVSQKNQVDTARLDTMKAIPEPTLSLREVFELHPWTEMADTMDHYKTAIPDDNKYPDDKYMEDHVMMAPLKTQLLLKTEQRYRLENLSAGNHSESLLGYYMHADGWATSDWSRERQDTMIYVAGWDAQALWYTYDPETKEYTPSDYNVTESDDYLIVPAKNNISEGHEFDTVYYCLRAQSKKSDGNVPESGIDGDYMYNICRYMVIYHQPSQYGPLKETTSGGIAKAIITNDEIEQRYEVLERLDFDYNQPGSSFAVYPHPLPWADASYGYTYPETPDLPHNRLHDQTALPNFGEYGLINRMHYTDYWYDMEQHGGAANGYMIYCDGMSSSGQVAALSLETHLCAGQKMFFSGYVGNPSKNKEAKYARPNFVFTVQGSADGIQWEDITSYTTGDLEPSQQWYQIFFPIIFNEERSYAQFRVRIYNMASNWDGNDFVIDDMRIIATKPPLIAYHANTACKEVDEEDTPTHVLLRVDYQGITGEGFNNVNAYYTLKRVDKDSKVTFVEMLDGYLREEIHTDTICGQLYIPGKTYEPQDPDSIFINMNEMIAKFDESGQRFKEGYIYEILEGNIRPVKYIIHSAYVNPNDTFTVHMAPVYSEMLSSICGLTSHLEVSNHMVLELNGSEQPEMEILGLCANATYDIGLRVKGSLYLDSIAPINLNGTCYNDWLLYGDTVESSSEVLYGYKYSDIVKVVKDILRSVPPRTTNANQFAPNLASVSRNEMKRIMDEEKVDLETEDHPYDVLAYLINNGFLTLYQPRVTNTVYTGDSVQYVIFPIRGTGTDALHHRSVEVCPIPIFVKLKPSVDSERIPLLVGGVHRDPSEWSKPAIVLADVAAANSQFKVRVDSIMQNVGIYSVTLRTTNDPDFRQGYHQLALIPDRDYPSNAYYLKGDSISFRPAGTNNYQMREGYSYTFDIVMQSILGSLYIDPDNPNSCRVGTVPFTLAVVPSYLRWSPQNETAFEWNNPANWLGIDNWDNPIHENARFAPLSSTYVLIPAMTDGMPYPVLPAVISSGDSVLQAGFQYNTCQAIRFMPGAAMSQQQNMAYSQAVIDMPIPHNQWAFRSAPVKGMISGDIFMANADIANETPLWEVGAFDAAGRTYKTGNASFWLSLYNTTVTHQNSTTVGDQEEVADVEWSKVTNGITLPLSPAQGFAVYARTSSAEPAAVRLPKSDDIYFYYTASGLKVEELYDDELQDIRNGLSSNHAGELAFHPVGSSETYTLTSNTLSNSFVFGNPTMGYIDIWGFIADNGLVEEIGYMAPSNVYTTVSKAAAEATTDEITNPQRYLPPMHAMMVKISGTATSEDVVVNTNRVLTSPDKKVRAGAPARYSSSLTKGIMTVTATNTVSPRCFSRLLLGQGYHDAIYTGEDALLTTLSINNYTNNTTPATPFNLYASEGDYGLCIDLRDSIVNIPLSFYLSDLPFDPTTRLWFTGVHNITGPLVLYDAYTDTERPIADGMFLDIVTPAQSHEIRYYIRRPGYVQGQSQEENPIATGIMDIKDIDAPAVKIIRNGHVFILRDGHIYTMIGQQVR